VYIYHYFGGKECVFIGTVIYNRRFINVGSITGKRAYPTRYSNLDAMSECNMDDKKGDGALMYIYVCLLPSGVKHKRKRAFHRLVHAE
jgi:hypothetical protein